MFYVDQETADEIAMLLYFRGVLFRSSRIYISARDVSGVFWAGLSTTVQPAASAGPILRVPIDSGNFHGVISSEGPTGRATVSTASSADGACRNRPGWRTASSANQRRNSAP